MFTKNEVLVQIKITVIAVTTLAQIVRYTSPNYTDHPQVDIQYTEYTVLKIFSPFRIFEQLSLALKNRVCPEIFHCMEYIFNHSGFLTTLRLL